MSKFIEKLVASDASAKSPALFLCIRYVYSLQGSDHFLFSFLQPVAGIGVISENMDWLSFFSAPTELLRFT